MAKVIHFLTFKNKEDPCLQSPCKFGQCSVDAKLKAACTCTNGYGGKECDESILFFLQNCNFIFWNVNNF